MHEYLGNDSSQIDELRKYYLFYNKSIIKQCCDIKI